VWRGSERRRMAWVTSKIDVAMSGEAERRDAQRGAGARGAEVSSDEK